MVTDSFQEEDNMAIQGSQTEKMSETMDKLDSRCFDIDKEMDNMKKEIDAVKKENADLKEQLRQQERRVTKVLSNQNDLEQCDRRWNLRLQRAGEDGGDTRWLRQNVQPDIYWRDQGTGQGGGSGSSTPDWTGGGMQKVDHRCAISVKETSRQGAHRQKETKREKGFSWWRPDTSQC